MKLIKIEKLISRYGGKVWIFLLYVLRNINKEKGLKGYYSNNEYIFIF